MERTRTAQVSALGYALPAIIGLFVVGGFLAWEVQHAKASLGVTADAPTQPVVAAGETRWLKGALHVHTGQSGDCTEPVDEVVKAYERAHFDFIVLTDHNHVTVAKGTPALLVIPGVELTENVATCEPPPEDPGHGCAMHVNALFADPSKVDSAFMDPHGSRREDYYDAELKAAAGLGALAQINHPNYRYSGADPALLVRLSKAGARFIEVGNAAKDVNTAGDAAHPPVEALWDDVLTQGGVLYATATDDAHNYSDADAVAKKGANPSIIDQGYVFVRAKKDVADIKRALDQGDFYASTGVQLDELGTDSGALSVKTSAKDALIRFIGEGGNELSRVNGPAGRFELSGLHGRYVRAVVEAGGHKAWTQPLWKSP